MLRYFVLAVVGGGMFFLTSQVSGVFIDLPTHLARQCVAEIGLQGRVNECSLMWGIQNTKAKYRNKPLKVVVNQYNSLMRRRKGNRVWVLDLNPHFSEPEGWPTNARWDGWRSRAWELKLTAAREWLDKGSRHPCPSANEYGGRCDDDVHACDETPMCWQRRWCGKPTDYWSQAYWYRPPKRRCSAVELL